MLRPRVVVLVIASAVASLWIAGTTIVRAEPATTAAVADAYVRCVEASDVECALNLFHLPTSLTPTQREEEKRFLKRALELFANELGRPREARITGLAHDAAFVSAGSGSLPYWQSHPRFQRFTFRTNFERDGAGTIAIDVCEIGGRPEVRQVQYGLLRTSPNATARVIEVGKKLQAMASGAPT